MGWLTKTRKRMALKKYLCVLFLLGMWSNDCSGSKTTHRKSHLLFRQVTWKKNEQRREIPPWQYDLCTQEVPFRYPAESTQPAKWKRSGGESNRPWPFFKTLCHRPVQGGGTWVRIHPERFLPSGNHADTSQSHPIQTGRCRGNSGATLRISGYSDLPCTDMATGYATG